MLSYFKLFINNEFVDAKSGKTFETINPANGKVITNVAEADKVSEFASIDRDLRSSDFFCYSQDRCGHRSKSSKRCFSTWFAVEKNGRQKARKLVV